MNILIENKITEARKFFEDTPFLSDVYDSAIKSYKDSSNPLRLSNFACNIRELLREKMSLNAPDKEILLCNWCKNNYLDKDGKPTRKARIRYYLLSNMDDTSLDNIFQEKIKDIEKEYVNKIDTLSKYTHITEKTFYITQKEMDCKFSEIMNLLIFIINFLDASKKLTDKRIEDFIYEDISDHVYHDYIDSELDLLSTHTVIDDVTNIEFSIQNINQNFILIEGTAELDVCLQYGSDSDRRKGDGDSFNMNFDLDFSVTININNLDDKNYHYEPINTDNFYGIDEGE